MLRIRRSKPVSGFTILPNEALRDERLSYCARGVLAELLSRPDKWETNADALSEKARRARGDVVGEGRRGMRAAFAELEAAGYMIRRKEKAANGRYSTVLEVYDLPQDRGTARGTSATGMSASGTSATGTSSRSTDHGSTDYEDGGDEHSAALAAARAARKAGAQDRLQADLQGWYDAADKLDDDRLRRHLLAFERRRPKIYRLCRQNALTQLGDKQGGTALLNSKKGVREVDLLAFKYALQYYVENMPGWLVKLPA